MWKFQHYKVISKTSFRWATRKKIILGSLNSSQLAMYYLYLVKHEQCLHLKYRIATGFDMSNLCVNKFLVLICLLVLL